MFLNLIDDIKFKILKDHFAFRELMELRLVSKEFERLIGNKIFWTVINLTDVGTAPICDLEKQFLHDNNSYIYRLSSKSLMSPIFSIPTSLRKYMIHNKLLII